MASTSHHRVAVVDDDFDIRAMLQLALEMNGYQVLTAANGQEALERLLREPPVALILLDLMMPIMNGWQFRTAQRAEPALAQIPVVLLSGDSQIAEAAAALQTNVFLQKPIELEALLRLVSGYFTDREAQPA